MKHMSPANGGLLRRGWARVRAYEPARLRAIWIAILALAGALGFTIPADVDAKVQGAIIAAAALIPLLQGEWTRSAVYSPATAERIATSAAEMAQLPQVTAPQAAAAAVDNGWAGAETALPADNGAVED